MLYAKELNQQECRDFLRTANFGRIACARDNQPYLVPFNFATDESDYIYAFATLGQKIQWMRENPLVCVEMEDINNPDDWTTLVIFGRYEELSEDAETVKLKDYAHELLASRPMWWKPAYLAGAHREGLEEKPIYFRIKIEKITGHRVFSGDFGKLLGANKNAKRPKLKTRGLL
jgi:nitroimidazol reductase NimA-like FMN-containing flavoprotein (pyridoxamine 5'-phosphate oxidase superfamily)